MAEQSSIKNKPSLAFYGSLTEMASIAAKRKMSSVEASMLSSIHYDNFFQIYDHNHSEENVFGAVLYMDKENIYGETSVLSIRMEEYIRYQIHKYFNLTFEQYIDQPRLYQRLMKKVCDEYIPKDNKEARELEEQLNNSLKNK